MKIFVLSNTSVYEGDANIYTGVSVHATEEDAFNQMVQDVNSDAKEHLGLPADTPDRITLDHGVRKARYTDGNAFEARYEITEHELANDSPLYIVNSLIHYDSTGENYLGSHAFPDREKALEEFDSCIREEIKLHKTDEESIEELYEEVEFAHLQNGSDYANYFFGDGYITVVLTVQEG